MCFNSNQGIVIEFSENSGLIKCSQNPQLFFLMSEVLEKKKLELNEKVDFSVVPVSEDEKGFVRQSAGVPGESSDLKALLLFFICKLVGSFSSQHETAEGRTQAIRIKRYSESVFLPVRKLGGVGASKGKVRRAFTFVDFI